MASNLSEQQRALIEEKRQRALALRAARQRQQPQSAIAADHGRNSSLVNNYQSMTDASSVRSLTFPQSSATQLSNSSGSTYLKDSLSRICPKTTTKCSSVKSSSTSSGCKPNQPTTLADSSNRAPAASVSSGIVVLGSSPPLSVKCCLVSRQKFAADTRYSVALVEIFKSIPSKQYGDELFRVFIVY